ncbi:unnamed protein product, partial [Allacma fusca]
VVIPRTTKSKYIGEDSLSILEVELLPS